MCAVAGGTKCRAALCLPRCAACRRRTASNRHLRANATALGIQSRKRWCWSSGNVGRDIDPTAAVELMPYVERADVASSRPRAARRSEHRHPCLRNARKVRRGPPLFSTPVPIRHRVRLEAFSSVIKDASSSRRTRVNGPPYGPGEKRRRGRTGPCCMSSRVRNFIRSWR